MNSTNTPPSNTYPVQLADPQLAVRWLRENYATYNINPSTICAYGSSAGAHMALLLGTSPTTTQSDMSNQYPTVSPQVSCVVDKYGPTDFLRLAITAPDVEKWYTLANYSTKGDAGLIEVSPLYKINANTPPLMIIQGELDTTVVPEHSEYLRDAAQTVNVPVTYISYPNAGHVLTELTVREEKVLADQIIQFVSSVIGRI